MKPSEIIRQGRIELYERGAQGGGLVDSVHGHVCALGALGFANGFSAMGMKSFGTFDAFEQGDLGRAVHYLADVIRDANLPWNAGFTNDVVVVYRTFDRFYGERLNEFVEFMDRAEKLAEIAGE